MLEEDDHDDYLEDKKQVLNYLEVDSEAFSANPSKPESKPDTSRALNVDSDAFASEDDY
jgi:hypothetical protein